MEPELIKPLIETWGPMGIVMIAGWYALKWLAVRDDERNKKVLEMVEKLSTVVANNTSALQQFSTVESQIKQVLSEVGKKKRAT